MGRGARTDQAASAAISTHELRRALDGAPAPRPAWLDAPNHFAHAKGRSEIADITRRALEAIPDDFTGALRLDGVVYRARLVWRLRGLHDRMPIAQHGPVRLLAIMACAVHDAPQLSQPAGPPRLCVIERERMSYDDRDEWKSNHVIAHSDHDLDAMIAALNQRAQELVGAGATEDFHESGTPWDLGDDHDSTHTSRDKVYEGLRRVERFGWH